MEQSFSKACRLSWARALTMACQTLGVFFGSSRALNRGKSASMSRCAYHTPRIGMSANSRIPRR